MNKEELIEALEIIKQPITVNCKEYKYFDQENYDKLISVYDNCLWIVNLFEQVKDKIEPIHQENQQLKEDIKNLIKIISKNCDVLEATEEQFESLYRWENE